MSGVACHQRATLRAARPSFHRACLLLGCGIFRTRPIGRTHSSHFLAESFMQTRREFCGGLCLATAAGGVLSTVPGCGGGGGGSGSSTSPTGTSAPSLVRLTGTVAGNQVSVEIAAGSALASTGGQALVQAGSNTLLVARTGASTFTALTAICTHEACVITNGDGGAFVCPCHGSRFDASGRVLTGPAVTSLRSFATAFSGSSLTITI